MKVLHFEWLFLATSAEIFPPKCTDPGHTGLMARHEASRMVKIGNYRMHKEKPSVDSKDGDGKSMRLSERFLSFVSSSSFFTSSAVSASSSYSSFSSFYNKRAKIATRKIQSSEAYDVGDRLLWPHSSRCLFTFNDILIAIMITFVGPLKDKIDSIS